MKNSYNKEIEGRIDYLDGIRGVAILLVALGHIFYGYYIFKFGWVGLNLFFILSGYLITGRLYVLLSNTPSSYFRNFYWNRLLRIFPLYYGCLIIFFIVLPFVFSAYFKFFGELFYLQGWYWTYTSNWMMIKNGLPKSPLFFHFWSLAIEEQFYVVWPFLFFIFQKLNKMKEGIGLLIVVSVILRNVIPDNLDSYLGTSTAVEPLVLGALIAVLQKQGRLEKVFNYFLVLFYISLGGLIFILIRDSNPHISNDYLLRIGYSAIDLVWAFLLIICILNKKYSICIRSILSIPVLKWLGKYSYGIYVFHYLVLNLFVYKFVADMVERGFDKDISYFSIRIIGIVVILALSYLSYNLYEKKFLALKRGMIKQ